MRNLVNLMIHVLFLAANPLNTARLRFDHESREIEKALVNSPNRDSFSINQSLAVRASDVAALYTMILLSLVLKYA